MNTILTIAYNTKEVVEASYKNLAEHKSPDSRVMVLNNFFPRYDKQEYTDFVKSLCDKYGFEYYDVNCNIGLHFGYNHLLMQSGTTIRGNKFVFWDGDCCMETIGFDKMLCDTLEGQTVWATCDFGANIRQLDECKAFKEEDRPCGKVRIIERAVINSVCALSGDWLDRVGLFYELSTYYGGIEIHMWNKLKRYGGEWVVNMAVKEAGNPHATIPEYSEYKVAHAITQTNLGMFA